MNATMTIVIFIPLLYRNCTRLIERASLLHYHAKSILNGMPLKWWNRNRDSHCCSSTCDYNTGKYLNLNHFSTVYRAVKGKEEGAKALSDWQQEYSIKPNTKYEWMNIFLLCKNLIPSRSHWQISDLTICKLENQNQSLASLMKTQKQNYNFIEKTESLSKALALFHPKLCWYWILHGIRCSLIAAHPLMKIRFRILVLAKSIH